jgi:hypothetical protein
MTGGSRSGACSLYSAILVPATRDLWYSTLLSFTVTLALEGSAFPKKGKEVCLHNIDSALAYFDNLHATSPKHVVNTFHDRF